MCRGWRMNGTRTATDTQETVGRLGGLVVPTDFHTVEHTVEHMVAGGTPQHGQGPGSRCGLSRLGADATWGPRKSVKTQGIGPHGTKGSVQPVTLVALTMTIMVKAGAAGTRQTILQTSLPNAQRCAAGVTAATPTTANVSTKRAQTS